MVKAMKVWAVITIWLCGAPCALAALFQPPDDYRTDNLIELGRQGVSDYGDIVVHAFAIGVLIAVVAWIVAAFNKARTEDGGYGKAIAVTFMALVIGVIGVAVLYYAGTILSQWSGR
jgi:hypothetical protein